MPIKRPSIEKQLKIDTVSGNDDSIVQSTPVTGKSGATFSKNFCPLSEGEMEG